MQLSKIEDAEMNQSLTASQIIQVKFIKIKTLK